MINSRAFLSQQYRVSIAPAREGAALAPIFEACLDRTRATLTTEAHEHETGTICLLESSIELRLATDASSRSRGLSPRAITVAPRATLTGRIAWSASMARGVLNSIVAGHN